MSYSIPNLKFLLDENVRIELSKFLKDNNFDLKLAVKSSRDKDLALLSKTERRIFVTNDEDFQWYSEKQIYCVIWLMLPQNDPKSLISSFKKLIKECQEFKGKLIVLYKNDWKAFPLPIIV